MQVVISASSVAWYGAVVATASGVKAVHDILNDRGRLKIRFQTDMMLVGGNDVEEDQVTIHVTNKSKRPAKITHVGMRFLPNWDRAMLYPNEQPRTLTEEDPATIYVKPQEGIDLDHLWFVYVIDARGKEYHWCKYKTGRLKWWQYKIRNLLVKLGIIKVKKTKKKQA